MYYKISEKKRKFRLTMLVLAYLVTLIPITYALLEVVNGESMTVPTWLYVIEVILGQVIPLGYYILHLIERKEVEDEKSSFLYPLFFMASIINLNLSLTRPYQYMTFFAYSPVKAWLRFLASPIILALVATLSWLYVLIRDKKKKSR